MKNNSNVWKVAYVLAFLSVAFVVYQHYHKQWLYSSYMVNKVMYEQCMHADSISKANGESLTLEQKHDCDSLRKLISDYDASH